MPYLEDIDKWILAKLNDFINISKSYYESYQLYKLMKVSHEVLDDISNWYVRRNRRRFWKSENDTDKLAAYHTLYRVLLTYTKIISPVIPFISDKIYQNLVSNIDTKESKSIHLAEFPVFNNEFKNDLLLEDIDAIKNIVNIGRSIRNKENIKIRQPLADIKIYIAGNNVDRLKKYNKQILEELNIKEIEYVKSESELVSYIVKPNFSIINEQFGDNKSEIISQINAMDKDYILNSFKDSNSIKLSNLNIELSKNCFVLEQIANDGYACSSSSKDIIISLNKELNDSLINEGITRDIIRKIQNLRKDSGFQVDDRIIVNILAEDQIINAVNKNKQYLTNEVLAVALNLNDSNGDFNTEFFINKLKVQLGISKNYK